MLCFARAVGRFELSNKGSAQLQSESGRAVNQRRSWRRRWRSQLSRHIFSGHPCGLLHAAVRRRGGDVELDVADVEIKPPCFALTLTTSPS
jgi:hypothetical protein